MYKILLYEQTSVGNLEAWTNNGKSITIWINEVDNITV